MNREGDIRKRVPPTALLLAACIVLCIAQGIAGRLEWGEYIAIPLFFCNILLFLYLQYDTLKKVSFAATLLIFIAVSCIIGTLTLQRPQANARSDEEYRDMFIYSQGSFLWKLLHPLPPSVVFSDAEEGHILEVGRTFGEREAKKVRLSLKKEKRAMMEEKRRGEFVNRYGHLLKALYPLFEGSRFTDLHNSWWFLFLLALLLVNITVCTLSRLSFRKERIGFLITHTGIIIFLAGAGATTLFKEKGFIPLEKGEGASGFYDSKGGVQRGLGFEILLSDFTTIYKRELFVAALSSGGGHREVPDPVKASFKVEEGGSITLNTGGMERELRGLKVLAPGEGGGPFDPGGMNLAIYRGKEEKGLLGSSPQSLFIEEKNLFKLKYHTVEGDSDMEAIVEDIPGGGYGALFMKEGDGDEKKCPVEEGKVCEGARYRVRVLEGYSRFVVENPVKGFEGYPANPAIRVSIEKGGEEEALLLFSKPEFRDFFRPSFKDLSIRYEFPLWDTFTGVWYRVVLDRSSGKGLLVTYRDGKREEVALDPSSSTDLPGTGYHIAFKREDKWRLSLKTVSGGEEREVTLTEGRRVKAFDGLVTLSFQENREKMPETWKSTLQVIEGGEVVKEEVVEVNSPLYHRGYRFYQSDADPKRPLYSGIQVIKDPGWNLTLPGLLLVLTGIFYTSFIKPLFKRSPG